jgi:hypothetical protein
MRRCFSCLLIFVIALPSFAEKKKDADELSIRATVLAVCNVISGPPGRRDWDRFKDLFAPGGRLAGYRDGSVRLMTTDEYIESTRLHFDHEGFFEWPVEMKVERHKDIAHVTSRYELRHATADAKPYATGVSHVELARSGDRWQVLSFVWQGD